MSRSIILALALLVTGGGIDAEPGHNKLADASFEETASGESAHNDAASGEATDAATPTWTPEVMAVNGDGDATSHVTRDGSIAFAGSNSLRLAGERDTVRWLGVMQAVPSVRAGQRYRLAAWMRTKDVHQDGRQYVNCNIFAQFKDGDGNVVRDENGYPVMGTPPILGSHGWTHVERIVRPPSGSVSASIGCFLSCSGTAWFDEVLFEPLPVPDWQVEDTGRYVYHWDHVGRLPPLVVRANEAFLEEQETRLETVLDHPVQYYYYDDNARKGVVTGNAGNAHAERADEIHSIFWTDRHEVVHLLTRRWGHGTALLAEGLAVHLSGSWQAEPVDKAARELRNTGTLLPLSRLVATTDFRVQDDRLTYPQAGSFVKHLFETYGVKRFRTIYTAAPLNPDAAAFDTLLKDSFGKDLATLETEWLATLESGG